MRVSVPLRGVGCNIEIIERNHTNVSVPLRGVGCNYKKTQKEVPIMVSVPLRGVGCNLCCTCFRFRKKCFRPLAGYGL